MHEAMPSVFQTCGGGGLRLLGRSTRRGQAGALTRLTQHVADGVDFGTVVAMPGRGAGRGVCSGNCSQTNLQYSRFTLYSDSAHVLLKMTVFKWENLF